MPIPSTTKNIHSPPSPRLRRFPKNRIAHEQNHHRTLIRRKISIDRIAVRYGTIELSGGGSIGREEKKGARKSDARAQCLRTDCCSLDFVPVTPPRIWAGRIVNSSARRATVRFITRPIGWESWIGCVIGHGTFFGNADCEVLEWGRGGCLVLEISMVFTTQSFKL